MVCSTPDVPSGLSVGSAVCVGGEIVIRPINDQEFSTELRADHIDLLSSPEVNKGEEGEVIFGAMSRSRPRLGLLRSEKGLHWRHRLPEMAAMLRLRAACKSIVHRAMQDRGYLEVSGCLHYCFNPHQCKKFIFPLWQANEITVCSIND